jgi:hypothetical protein
VERLDVRWGEIESDGENFGMSRSEMARNKVLLANVKKQLEALQGRSRQAPPQQAQQQSDGGDPSRGALQATAQTVMAAQDDMLSELGSGVSRLADQARMINDESQMHVRLLNDMEGDVEEATSGLRAEARHAEKIREESSVCKLYIIIVALTALLIFLIIMGFSR